LYPIFTINFKLNKEADMTYPIKHVVNCFLQRDFEDGTASITPMKMQKLLYFLHGWHLAITGHPVIEEKFSAWPYGPVEENLYHMLKNYRGTPITAYLKDGPGEPSFVVANTAEMFYKILDMVWRKYSDFSALQLSAMTHEQGTPWDMVYNHGTSPYIPNDMIQDYFKKVIYA